VKRRQSFEALHVIVSFSAQEVLIRAWFLRAPSTDGCAEEARLVLACCLVDSRGDVESRQRRAVLKLDGSGLHFAFGVAGVSGGVSSSRVEATPSTSQARKLRNESSPQRHILLVHWYSQLHTNDLLLLPWFTTSAADCDTSSHAVAAKKLDAHCHCGLVLCSLVSTGCEKLSRHCYTVVSGSTIQWIEGELTPARS
jgi:hypothetical protein